MKYPKTLTIEITPETDKLAREYTDIRACRLCQAVKARYPKARVRASARFFRLNDIVYRFSAETNGLILDGYAPDREHVLENAKPVTVIATRV